MKLNFFIDTHKGITFLAILGMMDYYHQWDNPTAWVYLGLHGVYGILWVMKSYLFPDPQWHRKTSLWFGLVSWGALTLYWIPPWLLVSRGVQAPGWLLAVAVAVNALGNFFHFTSDMQKFISLQLRPDILITDQFMALSRNINYFGEFLTYLAFALLAMTPLALIPLGLFIVFFWIPNMVRKDKVLAQLPGFEAYKRKTRAFFPFLF